MQHFGVCCSQFRLRIFIEIVYEMIHENSFIFKTPHPPCPSTSKILGPPWRWTSNFKQTSPSSSPLQMITNKLKENIIQGWLWGSSLRSTFVFSISSLILPGFPLISFHLAEALLLAFFVALYSAFFRKYHEMSFIYKYLHFAINLFYFQNLKT